MRKSTLTLLAALGLGALPLAHALQDPLRPVDELGAADDEVVQLAPVQDEASTPATLPRPDVGARLAEPDLDVRERHFDDIVAEAARSQDVAAELERLAAGDDKDLAWSARLALRELARSAPRLQSSPFSSPFFGGASPFGGGDPFIEMDRRMNEIFGGQGPRGGGRSPGGSLFGSSPFGGASPFGGTSPFGGQDPLEELWQEMERLRQGAQSGGSLFGSPGGNSTYRGSSKSLQVTPNGVRMEVTEQGPEGEETRVYEADSMEELYELYPELKDGSLQVELRSSGARQDV